MPSDVTNLWNYKAWGSCFGKNGQKSEAYYTITYWCRSCWTVVFLHSIQ